MPFARKETPLGMWLLGAMLAAGTSYAQYSTPVGTGAAKPKTLRATAVLEWTGSLQKPSASRLMPVAVWDGERYQPAGLYLAQPAPLAFETGTQYVLERMGEPAGLFNVRGAAQLNGDWIGMGKFQPEAPPPPPPKLKASKQLPILSNGRPDKPDSSDSDRPTLHRKGGADSSSTPASTTPASPTGSSTTPSQPAAKPTDTSDTTSSDSNRPTLHKRTSSDDSSGTQSTSSGSSTGTTSGTKTGSGTSTGTGTGGSSPTTTGNSGSSTSDSGSSDPDRPTLHKHDDSSSQGGSSTNASSDPDAPTLHKHTDATSPDVDPDRPTLHRAKSSSSAGLVTTSNNMDPDRPHLRYGKPDATEASMLPAKLEGAPAAMQQMVAVSDTATGEPHSYKYQWSSPHDATKMKTSLATVAAQLADKALHPSAAPASHTPATPAHPASHTATRAAKAPAQPLPTLADEDFKAFELSYSGGATVVYSARTEGEGAARVYVTLVAQPDFYGQPQVLFKQVTRADRLDVTPAMQLVDAVDTDNDGRAELIFQLDGGSTVASPQSAGDATPTTEREFAIYKVANGRADQVFTTGPLP